MDIEKWHAIAIQSIILALSIACFIAGVSNPFIIVSVLIVLFLFILQTFLGSRFMYLFPVNISTGVKTPTWDTWILRCLIVLAILFLYLGSTELLYRRFLS